MNNVSRVSFDYLVVGVLTTSSSDALGEAPEWQLSHSKHFILMLGKRYWEECIRKICVRKGLHFQMSVFRVIRSTVFKTYMATIEIPYVRFRTLFSYKMSYDEKLALQNAS